MTVRIGALVFSSPRPAATVEFYRLIGIDLAEEDHGDGVAHWACEVGDVHVAVFASDTNGTAPGYHQPGSTFCGFVVEDVATLTEELRASGRAVIQEPNLMSWGIRAVVLDPDGRPVEIFQPT